MNSLPEQFSAARLTQLDNGFKLMHSLSDGMLDRTSRVLALQLDASRAAVEQSSSAMRQLLAARDPRDLLALGSQSQQHLRTMLDYSRALFGIAAGVNLSPLRSYSVDTPALDAPAALETAPLAEAAANVEAVEAVAETASEAFERTGSDTASAAAAAAAAAVSATENVEPVVDAAASAIAEVSAPATPAAPSATEMQAAAEAFERTGSDTASSAAQSASAGAAQAATGAATVADPVLPADTDTSPAALSVVTSDVEPQAEPTPIARATSAALDIPVAPPHPVAASVPVEVAVEIELPKVEPVDAVPPPVAPAALRSVETRGTKGRKKQNG